MEREMIGVVADLRTTSVMEEYCDITKRKDIVLERQAFLQFIEALQNCKYFQLIKYTFVT